MEDAFNIKKENMPISVLLDLSVYRLGMMSQAAVKNVTVPWGGSTLTAEVHGTEPKPLPTGKKLIKDRECMPTFTRLIREGSIKAYNYSELRFEEWGGRRGATGSNGDLFHDVVFNDAQAAIDRSFRNSLEISECIDREAFIEFCEFLLSLEPGKKSNVQEFSTLLDDFQKINLNNLSRFRELCSHLNNRNQYPDAFHLWTAETNKLDYFLTCDYKFRNAMIVPKKIIFPTPPISPESLLEKLGIIELDKMPDLENGFLC